MEIQAGVSYVTSIVVLSVTTPFHVTVQVTVRDTAALLVSKRVRMSRTEVPGRLLLILTLVWHFVPYDTGLCRQRFGRKSCLHFYG
jgi:hypothetical protein